MSMEAVTAGVWADLRRVELKERQRLQRCVGLAGEVGRRAVDMDLPLEVDELVNVPASKGLFRRRPAATYISIGWVMAEVHAHRNPKKPEEGVDTARVVLNPEGMLMAETPTGQSQITGLEHLDPETSLPFALQLRNSPTQMTLGEVESSLADMISRHQMQI